MDLWWNLNSSFNDFAKNYIFSNTECNVDFTYELENHTLSFLDILLIYIYIYIYIYTHIYIYPTSQIEHDATQR